MLVKLKKAAMFGLDARIALAIFGALSVISGVTIYNAIKKAEAIVLLTEMQEVGKAHEQYYIDTRRYLDFSSGSGVLATVNKLVSDNLTGWKGPYLSYEEYNSENLIHPLYDYIGFLYAKDGTWSGNINMISWDAFNSYNKCSGGTITGSCYSWVLFYYVDEGLYNLIDSMVDGVVGHSTGKVRMATISGKHLILMKSIPRK